MVAISQQKKILVKANKQGYKNVCIFPGIFICMTAASIIKWEGAITSVIIDVPQVGDQ